MKTPVYLLSIAALVLAACGEKTSPPPGSETAQKVHPIAMEAPELIARESIFGNPDRTLARISPDGQYVSWLAPDKGVMNVWVASADSPDAARVVTEDTYRGISIYFWAPNSKYVYYIQDKGGDENYHIYASDIETAEVRDLTPVADGVRATIEQLSSARPDHIVVGINERDPQLFDLYLVDVESGERELLRENPATRPGLSTTRWSRDSGLYRRRTAAAELLTWMARNLRS